MRTGWCLLALVALVPLTACGDGDPGDDAPELAPGPATEGLPGAAGSMTLEQWDDDLDGALSREEFGAWWEAQESGADALAEGFQRHDVVGQAEVDPDTLTSDDELRDRWFDRLDADNDGRIDATEWEAWQGGR